MWTAHYYCANRCPLRLPSCSTNIVTFSPSSSSSSYSQLYGSFSGPSGGLASIPVQQLLAFRREFNMSSADPQRTVTFTVPRAALALVTPAGAMAVSAGVWTLTLGGGPPSNANYAGGSAVLKGTLAVQ